MSGKFWLPFIQTQPVGMPALRRNCDAVCSFHGRSSSDHKGTSVIHEGPSRYRDLYAKQVSEITGLGKNTVKAIDLKRLQDKYTIDGQTLIKPEQTTRFLGIDEFSRMTDTAMPLTSSTCLPGISSGSRTARKSRSCMTSSSMSVWNGWTTRGGCLRHELRLPGSFRGKVPSYPAGL